MLAALIIIVALLICIGELSWKDASTAILALFSTFLGATFAFRLNENKEEEKIRSLQKEVINHSLFILLRQYNALALIKKKIEIYTTQFDLAFNLPVFKPPSYTDLNHDFYKLEFILASSKPNILLNLTLEQERFEQAIEALRLRNDFCLKDLQPLVAQLAINQRETSLEETKNILGEKIFFTAINLSKSLKGNIDATILSNQIIYRELKELGKELFPETKFIDYKF